jgi:hypothetical protein
MVIFKYVFFYTVYMKLINISGVLKASLESGPTVPLSLSFKRLLKDLLKRKVIFILYKRLSRINSLGQEIYF